jgi:hypothetical protein
MAFDSDTAPATVNEEQRTLRATAPIKGAGRRFALQPAAVFASPETGLSIFVRKHRGGR